MGVWADEHAEDETSRIAFLFEIATDPVMRLNDSPYSVFHEGNWYRSIPIDAPSGIGSQQGSLDGATSLTVANADLWISASDAILTGIFDEAECRVLLAFFDPMSAHMETVDAQLLLSGSIDEITTRDGLLELGVSSSFVLAARLFLRRRFADTCQVGFGSELCGKTGTAATCDKSQSATTGCAQPTTLATPATFGNLARLNSMPWLQKVN